MKKFRLIINLYQIDNAKRLDEISICLQKNIENELISEIVILDEGFPRQELLQNKKITVELSRERPLFSDYFEHLGSDCINILSNNDIWFDETLKRVSWLRLGKYDLLGLTRTEPDGSLYRESEADTQDAWIFNELAEPLKNCNFPMGIPGCENRLSLLFFAKRYRVLNPSKIIRANHEHASKKRNYSTTDRVEGHYLMTRPIGLIGFYIYRIILRTIQRSRILLIKKLD